jgi:hypothetical protein
LFIACLTYVDVTSYIHIGNKASEKVLFLQIISVTCHERPWLNSGVFLPLAIEEIEIEVLSADVWGPFCGESTF